MPARVHQLEKAFLVLGGVILVAFLFALFFASLAMGINLPGKVEDGIVDPTQVRSLPPFDEPGVRPNPDGGYTAVIRGEMWRFIPEEIVVPAGAEITFLATSPDVIHGLHVEDTRVNMMLIPGQIARNRYTFDEPGRRRLLCHEYCGPLHHQMAGSVLVVSQEEWESRQAETAGEGR